MKITCEVCEGKGRTLCEAGDIVYYTKCDICGGSGRIDDKELEEDIRLGRAVKKAYSMGALLIYDIQNSFDCDKGLYTCAYNVADILDWEEK